MPALVQIEKGRYSRYLQVARAMLSAASATASTDKQLTIVYLDAAITELRNLKSVIARR